MEDNEKERKGLVVTRNGPEAVAARLFALAFLLCGLGVFLSFGDPAPGHGAEQGTRNVATEIAFLGGWLALLLAVGFFVASLFKKE